ncbi:DNA gyrase subunit B [Streptomyces sp. CdTB01]|uniref:DNA gyrase subunit B n=1 Tax=Streptomyces sp. CdTB01 TaxID=1725411 RepID=UPI00073A8FBF|nr:DNA gyrase subunit B [Streptomyces sp. CdTB01]ALV35463.1 DNA gyrase subunit B [Streptomyces sp. CdTB01]
MSGDRMEYSAADIEVLEGPEAVRKRPGMWVGSVGERGLHQAVFEVVGRAVNAVLARGAGSVDVTLTPDGGVRVVDDGPAAPFEADVGAGLDAQLTSFQTGSGPGTERLALVGAFAVGPVVTNALSSRLTAEVRYGGVRHVREYVRGAPVGAAVTTGPAPHDGTTITFRPDTEIFETTSCSFAVLAERLRQVAFLNRGVAVSLTDERPADGPRAVRFRFPDGVRDFVAALVAEEGVALGPEVIGFEREDQRMAGTMEVALAWRGLHGTGVRGFVNGWRTPECGTHVDGFRDGVTAAFTSYAAGLSPSRVDALVTAVVSVKLDRPEFLGSTGGLLGNAEVRLCVAEAVREHLDGWLEGHPERAAEVVRRIAQDGEPD